MAKLTHIAQVRPGNGPFDVDLPGVEERSVEGALHFVPSYTKFLTFSEAEALKGDPRLNIAPRTAIAPVVVAVVAEPEPAKEYVAPPDDLPLPVATAKKKK